MLNYPAQKYRPFQPVDLPDRTWPTKSITHPPVWLSTDLRDGNQALIEPMNGDRKQQMFDMLVAIGFKEIEVSFPAASQTDFDFVRRLIEADHIPDDVTIQVLTQCREHLIRRTFESLKGAKRAIVHIYNSTSPVFRETVFRSDRAGTIAMAVAAAQLCNELAAAAPETEWRFQYSPENFTLTELDFARDICNAVLDVWQPTPELPAIINLPATVEVSTPNGFADQVEWMHRQLRHRDRVVLSVHTHNDRGCAIAAAELAQMAGADRVEGCLFGNGERTGNVDLVTLALNLYTQGIHPGLDFAKINDIARTVEACTQLPIHPRHPYVGDLVFTAFSGSHQDAIKKGFAAQSPDGIWQVPYLPIDPIDVGRSYESVIRVNSQSGKGGMAYLLEQDYGLVMPRRMQIEFSQVVQRVMDDRGTEMSSHDLWQIWLQEYVVTEGPLQYKGHHLTESDDVGRDDVGDDQQIMVTVAFKQQPTSLAGCGNGPIDALLNALDLEVRVHHYEERSLSHSSKSAAVTIVELAGIGDQGSVYGAGIHDNIVTSSFLAIMSAINRGMARSPHTTAQICQRFEPLSVA